jgi:hypothetical protein
LDIWLWLAHVRRLGKQRGCSRHCVATLEGYGRTFDKASIRNCGSNGAPCPTLNLLFREIINGIKRRLKIFKSFRRLAPLACG